MTFVTYRVHVKNVKKKNLNNIFITKNNYRLSSVDHLALMIHQSFTG